MLNGPVKLTTALLCSLRVIASCRVRLEDYPRLLEPHANNALAANRSSPVNLYTNGEESMSHAYHFTCLTREYDTRCDPQIILGASKDLYMSNKGFALLDS